MTKVTQTSFTLKCYFVFLFPERQAYDCWIEEPKKQRFVNKSSANNSKYEPKRVATDQDQINRVIIDC